MRRRLSSRAGAACALCLGALWAGACGGRVAIYADGAGGAAVSAAGRASAPGEMSGSGLGAGGAVGGVPSSGAPAGGAVGGVVVSGTAAGGAVGDAIGSGGDAGAAVICDSVTCPVLRCGPTSVLTGVAGACCPFCQTTCSAAAFQCADGYHREACTQDYKTDCVSDHRAERCAQERREYAVDLPSVEASNQIGCSSDADCVAVVPNNRCKEGCQYVVVPRATADVFNAVDFVGYYCPECANIPPVSRGCVPPKVYCANNRCVGLKAP